MSVSSNHTAEIFWEIKLKIWMEIWKNFHCVEIELKIYEGKAHIWYGLYNFVWLLAVIRHMKNFEKSDWQFYWIYLEINSLKTSLYIILLGVRLSVYLYQNNTNSSVWAVRIWWNIAASCNHIQYTHKKNASNIWRQTDCVLNATIQCVC